MIRATLKHDDLSSFFFFVFFKMKYFGFSSFFPLSFLVGNEGSKYSFTILRVYRANGILPRNLVDIYIYTYYT